MRCSTGIRAGHAFCATDNRDPQLATTATNASFALNDKDTRQSSRALTLTRFRGGCGSVPGIETRRLPGGQTKGMVLFLQLDSAQVNMYAQLREHRGLGRQSAVGSVLCRRIGDVHVVGMMPRHELVARDSMQDDVHDG